MRSIMGQTDLWTAMVLSSNVNFGCCMWLLHVYVSQTPACAVNRAGLHGQMLLLDNFCNAVAVYQSSVCAGLQAGVPVEALHHAASQGV